MLYKRRILCIGIESVDSAHTRKMEFWRDAGGHEPVGLIREWCCRD